VTERGRLRLPGSARIEASHGSTPVMPGLTHAGGRFAAAAGPAIKASNRASPLFNCVSAKDLGLYSIVFSLCPCISLFSLPCAHDTITARTGDPFVSSPPPCRTGHGPMCPSRCCAALSRPDSSLLSPRP
jgi:hypothetical protein